VAFTGSETDFSRLEHRIELEDPGAAPGRRIPVYVYLFDILYWDGFDLTKLALRDRKRVLRRAIDFHGPVRYTPHRNTTGEAYYRQACRAGWEGVMAKLADSPYEHRRSKDWLKFKCQQGQEFVIGGFTDPEHSRQSFGALLLGYYRGDQLVYAGKVGSGFDEHILERLGERLDALEQKQSPFTAGQPPRHAHWVRPEVVAEVRFSQWTTAGRLRHPVFQGLRDDKSAREVVREGPA
jgi:bifunctional non-homologous end joining protein LigD